MFSRAIMNTVIRVPTAFFAVVSLLFANGASAGDYARDPCRVPSVLAKQPAEYATAIAQYDALSAKSSELDSTSETFNQQCKVQKIVGSPGEVACARRQRDIETALEAHSRKIDAFHQYLSGSLEARIAALQGQMTSSRAELLRVSSNAQKWQQEIDGWIDLGDKARDDAQLHAVFAAIDIVADSERDGLKVDIALDEGALSTFKSLYASGRKFIPVEFQAGLERELLTMRTQRDLLTLLQHLNLTADRASSAYEPFSEGKNIAGFGQFTVGVLRESLPLMEASPEAKITVTALDMAEHSLYGWWAHVVAEKHANQFIGLEEKQLRAVDAISSVYIREVENRKSLNNALSALRGAPCYKSD